MQDPDKYIPIKNNNLKLNQDSESGTIIEGSPEQSCSGLFDF